MAHHQDIHILGGLGEQGLQPLHLRLVEDIVETALRTGARAVEQDDAQALFGNVIIAIDLAGREVQVLPRLLLPGLQPAPVRTRTA